MSLCKNYSQSILLYSPRLVKCLLLILAALLSMGASPPVLTTGTVPNLRLYPSHIARIAHQSPVPAVDARSALLVDVDTGVVLFEKEPDTRMPPASTTKIMTAILAIEQGNLPDVVTVPEGLTVIGSNIGLQAGESLTLEELLFALLLPSANDAALVIARHIAGSVDAFVDVMNEKAEALGLSNTHFENPHGLDSPNHLSSAKDLWTLTSYAMQNATFSQIVATPATDLAGRGLVNTNQLLGSYLGADGVKTGTTDLAGQCLVATVNRGGHRALVVILGSTDRYLDARALFDYYDEAYGWLSLQIPSTALTRMRNQEGDLRTLRLNAPVEVFLDRWQWDLVQPALQITADAEGEPVGLARFRVGPTVLLDVPLVAEAP